MNININNFIDNSQTNIFNYNQLPSKKHFDKTVGIPQTCPLKCFTPAYGDIPENEPEILVGMDSGVSNTAFSFIELVKDNDGAVIDFTYRDSFYFEEELNEYSYQMDKQFFLANKYYDLFARQRVRCLTFEVLTLNTAKNQETLKALVATQTTTSLISAIAYSLGHRYNALPATKIKYCLTGYGRADKNDMCLIANHLTGDERLLLNDHMADSFCNCIYEFIQILKEDCKRFNKEIPYKFKAMAGR